jgi:hypothetical protein
VAESASRYGQAGFSRRGGGKGEEEIKLLDEKPKAMTAIEVRTQARKVRSFAA